jgi:ElaB/YqjD/DUF883 family membrane-anchored ribosome-binding protein
MAMTLAIMVVAIIGVFAYIWFTERDLLRQLEDVIQKQEKLNKKLNDELVRIQFEQQVEKNEDKIQKYMKYNYYTRYYEDKVSFKLKFYDSWLRSNGITKDLKEVIDFVDNVSKAKSVICKEECEKAKESNSAVFTIPETGTYVISASVSPNDAYIDSRLIKKVPKKKKGKKK